MPPWYWGSHFVTAQPILVTPIPTWSNLNAKDRQKPLSKYEQALKEDFRNFLFAVWKFLGLPEPTPVQYEMADWLQSGPNRKMTEGFRGVGKSWITSAYVLWVLRFHNADYKFEIVSASKSRADDFSAFTKRLINEMPILWVLKPDPSKGHRDSMIAFDVGPCRPAHAPSVKSVGIFGQLTGSRANEIIADDIEVPNNSCTQDSRDKLEKAATEFEAIIVPGGKVTYLGTPQSEESIYNKLSGKGYAVRIWPARCPTMLKLAAYRGNLAPSITERLEAGTLSPGDPIDPKRFTDQDLLEREASYGRSGFALQFMLDTSLADAERYPLKLADLIITNMNDDKAPIAIQYGSSPDLQMKELPNVGFTGDKFYRPLFMDKEWAPYEGSCMAIDPSGRGKDDTGYAVTKQLHGYLYVPEAGGLKGGYDDETLIQLAKVAQRNKVNYIIIESNFGDGMFTKLFTPILAKYWPCTVEEVRHNIQKEKRIIDTLEPLMNRHRLIIDPRVIVDDLKGLGDTLEVKMSLFYQLTHITKDRGALKHDDRLDALAMAVAYWVDSMSRDEKVALDSWKEAALDRDLEDFMENCVGFKKPVSGWINSR
jgi:hypothetical protein